MADGQPPPPSGETDLEGAPELDLPPPTPRRFEPEMKDTPSLPCGLCDLEQVHKISQLLLPGLAAACVDATAGYLFHGPASVALNVRKDMVEYLTRRSESHVAQSVLSAQDPAAAADPGSGTSAEPAATGEGEGEGDGPAEIVSDFLEDFAPSKRNLLGRVSGWLMCENREDKIDDFAQEMQANGSWLADRREALAETLLKNLDYTNSFHCEMRFDTSEQLSAHQGECRLRLVNMNMNMKSLVSKSFSSLHIQTVVMA